MANQIPSPPKKMPRRLTEAQSRRRIAALRKRGCQVSEHELASGDVVVLKKCPRGANPDGHAITAEVPWWSGRVVVERAGEHYHARAVTRGGRVAHGAGGRSAANALGNLRSEVERARAANHRELLRGGRAAGRSPSDFDQRELAIGTRVEGEHTTNLAVAREIAMDHLAEDRNYYRRLARIDRDAASIRRKFGNPVVALLLGSALASNTRRRSY